MSRGETRGAGKEIVLVECSLRQTNGFNFKNSPVYLTPGCFAMCYF